MKKLVLSLALFIAACGSSSPTKIIPSGHGGGIAPFPIQFPQPTGLHVKPGYNGIFYHGGPVMLGTINMYYIWYGNWANNTAQIILENFAKNIGGSPYFNINTTYYDVNKAHISNSVSFGGSTIDNYSQGMMLSDSKVENIVATAINNKSLPQDINAIYFVLTSSDVIETSGFCSYYCGWHTRYINGQDIKYAFVGDASVQCQRGCAAQSISPNDNVGADGMASVIAHELEETVTDPDLNAWYDNYGDEVADKCGWTFGETYTVTNGSSANMNLGEMDYLIQQNWVNASNGYCAFRY